MPYAQAGLKMDPPRKSPSAGRELLTEIALALAFAGALFAILSAYL